MMIEPLTEQKLDALLGPSPTQVSSDAGIINGDNYERRHGKLKSDPDRWRGVPLDRPA